MGLRRVEAELVRMVCSGGRIGLANWTPGGFIGELDYVVETVAPPPLGLRPPTAWGSETRMVDHFRRHYGPVLEASETLDPARREELPAALLELLGRYNRGGRGALIVPADYLEVVILRA